MAYAPLFDPDKRPADQRVKDFTVQAGDIAKKSRYVYNSEISLAVNVALATGRPLLVRGNPGSGKSSLARDVAERLGWRYYDFVVTSRTEASDMLYRFDTVRRFNDANAGQGKLKSDPEYVEPKALWWAFSPQTAQWRGVGQGQATQLEDPSTAGAGRAVVLVDEIDKADPDVPNNLLVALGAREFEVPEINRKISAEQVPLLVITTNNERALPEAFLRRCVTLELPDPDPPRLRSIAVAHLGQRLSATLLDQAVEKWAEVVAEAERLRVRSPGTAEFLDLLWACEHLGITDENDERWADISQATLWKHEKTAAARSGQPRPDAGTDEL